MSVTKHKIIKIPILSEDDFAMEELSIQALNEFLGDSNVVYLGHTICIATRDSRIYGSTITKNSHLIVSIVYKDLAGTAVDLSKVSRKVKEVVRREVAEGEQFAEPEIMTEFDKKANMIDSGSGTKHLEEKPKKNISRNKLE